MFKKILIVLVVAVGGFLAFAATRPDTYHVERSTKIDAPAAVVYAQLENLKAWEAWSPWEKRDPAMKKTYEGPPVGVGSAYSWEGKESGAGKMTVTGSEAPRQLKLRLEFIKPFTATAAVDFRLASAGKTTGVTWAMDGTNNLMGKVFSIFMNMDQSIGGDFEKGLASLKTVAEAEAEKQAAAAKAKAEADAAAAAVVRAQAEAETLAALEAAAAPKGKAKGKK
jgi:hypothetical protein